MDGGASGFGLQVGFGGVVVGFLALVMQAGVVAATKAAETPRRARGERASISVCAVY